MGSGKSEKIKEEEIEARRLDKLNHYRAAFEMLRTAGGPEIDADCFRRFTALVESFGMVPGHLEGAKALLMEAGRNEDAHAIRETLPAFCENMTAMYRGDTENTADILRRLKKAIEGGDTGAAGETVKELGTKSLTPAERELYFKLYDALLEDNIKRAVELLSPYGVV